MYTYKPNCILTLREEEGLPVFGEIKEILIYNAFQVIFITHELTTNNFHHHYHAYHVEKTDTPTVTCTKHTDISDHIPLELLETCSQGLLGNHYIVPRYNIFS